MGISAEENKLRENKFEEGLAWCGKCKQFLPLNEFSNCKCAKYGVYYVCTKCRNILRQTNLYKKSRTKYQEKNRERIRKTKVFERLRRKITCPICNKKKIEKKSSMCTECYSKKLSEKVEEVLEVKQLILRYTRAENFLKCLLNGVLGTDLHSRMIRAYVPYARSDSANISLVKNTKICSKCGSIEKVQQHHIEPVMFGGSVTVPLCSECHIKEHSTDLFTASKLANEAISILSQDYPDEISLDDWTTFTRIMLKNGFTLELIDFAFGSLGIEVGGFQNSSCQVAECVI